jgi:Tol biopolymer transport system component
MMRKRSFNPSAWSLATTAAAFLLAFGGCGSSDTTGPNPQPTAETGSIAVTAVTTGSDPDDAYLVAVDGNAEGAIGANATLTVKNLSAGSHTVSFTGVAANCTASNGTQQTATVTVGDTTAVEFAVACVPNTGTFRVITVTDGLVLDPNGYSIAVDGGTPTTLAVNDTATIDAQVGTSHTLALADQAANCTPHGLPEMNSSVAFGDTTTVTFTLTCFDDPIVFERRDTTGRNDLYVVDASGGTEVRLTDGTSTFYSFLASPAEGSAWDPTKTHIAFQSSSETDFTEYDVHVMALNKSESYHLAMTAPQFAPVWSPDGSKLLFGSYTPMSGGGYTNNTWTANPDLTGATNVSPTNAWDAGASWSPDGTKILFARDSSQVGGPNSTIWVMNADGSGKVDVSDASTLGAGDFDWAETWSLDGSRIVFVRNNFAGAAPLGDIWAVDPDGGNLTQLTNTTEREDTPLWSPDGTKIYFKRCADTDCTGSDVWVMNADGSNVTQVTTSGAEALGDWNATTTFAGTVSAGTSLITWSVVGTVGGSAQTYQGRLFLQAPDGSNRTALTSATGDAQNPHWH